jgi:hypothetical protein
LADGQAGRDRTLQKHRTGTHVVTQFHRAHRISWTTELENFNSTAWPLDKMDSGPVDETAVETFVVKLKALGESGVAEQLAVQL